MSPVTPNNEVNIVGVQNPPGGTSTLIQVLPLGTLPFYVQYTPKTSPENLTVTFTVMGHDSVDTMATLTVNAIGDPAFPLAFTETFPGFPKTITLATPQDQMIVPAFLDTAIHQTVQLTNTSSNAITLSSAPQILPVTAGPAVFSLDTQFPVTVQPGQAVPLDFVATPAAGMPSGEIQAIFDWNLQLLPTDPPVQFAATGWEAKPLPAAVPGLSFSNVIAGQSQSQLMQLPMNPPLPLDPWLYRATNVSITGTNAALFSFALPSEPSCSSASTTTNPCPPFVFGMLMLNGQANQVTVPIQVTFSPASAGTYNAQLNLTLDGFSQPISMALQGSAVASTTSCSAPLTACTNATGGTSCVDLTSDSNNCGACGKVCAATTTCKNSACVAGPRFFGKGDGTGLPGGETPDQGCREHAEEGGLL